MLDSIKPSNCTCNHKYFLLFSDPLAVYFSPYRTSSGRSVTKEYIYNTCCQRCAYMELNKMLSIEILQYFNWVKMKLKVQCYQLKVNCYQLNVQCYQLKVKCYQLHVQCNQWKVKWYQLKVQCYKLKVKWYQLKVQCYKLKVQCNQLKLKC